MTLKYDCVSNGLGNGASPGSGSIHDGVVPHLHEAPHPPAIGSKKVDEVRPADLDRLYAQLRKSLSAARVLKIHTILRAALGQAVKWDMLHDNPAAHATLPRVTRPPISPPPPEQVAILLAAVDEYDQELGVYVRLAAVTGARRGELCALRWSDVDLAGGEVVIARSIVHGVGTVIEKETKTNRACRIALDDVTAGQWRHLPLRQAPQAGRPRGGP